MNIRECSQIISGANTKAYNTGNTIRQGANYRQAIAIALNQKRVLTRRGTTPNNRSRIPRR